MSVPQMSLDDAGRPRWLEIAAGVWLVLVNVKERRIQASDTLASPSHQ